VFAPVVIVAKILLEELCRNGLSWGQNIPSEAEEAWQTWLRKLPLLAEIDLPRCLKPERFGEIKTWQLHHFADASCRAYAAVSYMRLVYGAPFVKIYLTDLAQKLSLRMFSYLCAEIAISACI